MRESATAERLGQEPPYVVQPTDLRPYAAPCEGCGGPAWRLSIEIPAGKEGTSYREAPVYDQLAGYTRYFSRALCSHCELRGIVADLFPPAPMVIESPESVELRELRARLDPPKPKPPEAPVEGAIFKPGERFATRAALGALAREHVPRFDPTVGGSYEAGRPFLADYLRRHLTGDFGNVGRHGDASAARGARMGPLATALDRNAAAVMAGLGTVLSQYPLGSATTHRATLVIRSELGLQPLTLVALAEELPNR